MGWIFTHVETDDPWSWSHDDVEEGTRRRRRRGKPVNRFLGREQLGVVFQFRERHVVRRVVVAGGPLTSPDAHVRRIAPSLVGAASPGPPGPGG